MTIHGKSHDMNRKVDEQCDGAEIYVESTSSSGTKSTIAAVSTPDKFSKGALYER